MKFGVIIFPASNCAEDCYYVLSSLLNQNTKYFWHKSSEAIDTDVVILPGGFSFGDYLRCGAIARFSPVMERVIEFAGKGGLVIGICNGFQILTESGLLPGTLMKNTCLKFICSPQYLKVENNYSVFSKKYNSGDVINCPIAHNEGNYFADENTINKLEKNNQILFRYCDENGNVNDSTNPNGSVNNIAGIINIKGNVLGLMPHPERSSEKILLCDDGIKLFKSIIEFYN